MKKNPLSKNIHSRTIHMELWLGSPDMYLQCWGKREDVDHLNQGFNAYKFIHILLNIYEPALATVISKHNH
jgi:hypothetical protein